MGRAHEPSCQTLWQVSPSMIVFQPSKTLTGTMSPWLLTANGTEVESSSVRTKDPNHPQKEATCNVENAFSTHS